MAEFLAIEMAEWIERGLEFAAGAEDGARVRESPRAFLEFVAPAYRAGPLGLALIGRDGDPETALHRWLKVAENSPAGRMEAAARLLGIPVALARLVELNHRGGIPARAIARCLRAGALGMAMAADSRPAAAAAAARRA